MKAMHSFDGHPDTYNYLKPDYKTHVDLPTNRCNLETSHAKLAEATKYVGKMSVKGLADYDQNGEPELKPKWPFKMRLLPVDPCGFPDEWDRPFYE